MDKKMQKEEGICSLQKFDAVVMFTWSDWFTEPVSNRYHYASRFGRITKVIFIQPDITKGDSYTEPTELENVTVLHVSQIYGEHQGKQIDYALLKLKILTPLFWIYNVRFVEYIERYNASLKIFHATEDYLSWKNAGATVLRSFICKTLSIVDIVVSVSKKVMKNYNALGIGKYKSLLLENGCDYNFWHLTEQELMEKEKEQNRIIIYQGGINWRIDFSVLEYIAQNMKGWELWICGKGEDDAITKIINNNKNVRYFGFLSIREVRELCIKATVGIIPFVNKPELYNCLPLKAFEYMAAGLSIVTTPIAALEQCSPYIHFANTPAEFVDEIEKAHKEKSIKDLRRKLESAKCRDYDRNFLLLLNAISEFSNTKRNVGMRKKINILYDEGSMHVFTIKNYLEMFERYSRHMITYTAATRNASCSRKELEGFDAIIIFYSIRVCFRGHLSADFEKALVNYRGHKILMIQDDYDNTEETRKFIERVKINTVFTAVPQEYIDAVYPKERFANVNFFNIMTGYISDEMKNYPNKLEICERSILIGYRGRDIGYWYGNLAREKLEIGIKMRKICIERGLKVDIEWESDKRIYTEKWLEWLSACKATLGTESGSNIFDDEGELKKIVEQEIAHNPKVTYQEIFDKYLKSYEGKVKMNQISPKLLEAISLKTALILYEGNYSGILKPGVHYIPLKKDFSNIDDVLEKLADDEYLQNMVNFTYEDIISNFKLSYQWLIEYIDKCIDSNYLLYESKGKGHAFFRSMINRIGIKNLRV